MSKSDKALGKGIPEIQDGMWWGGAMIEAATTEVLMAWGNPQEPPLFTQRVKMTERKFRVLGRLQGDTELTRKVPNTPTTGRGDRSQLQ